MLTLGLYFLGAAVLFLALAVLKLAYMYQAARQQVTRERSERTSKKLLKQQEKIASDFMTAIKRSFRWVDGKFASLPSKHGNMVHRFDIVHRQLVDDAKRVSEQIEVLHPEGVVLELHIQLAVPTPFYVRTLYRGILLAEYRLDEEGLLSTRLQRWLRSFYDEGGKLQDNPEMREALFGQPVRVEYPAGFSL